MVFEDLKSFNILQKDAAVKDVVPIIGIITI